MFHNRLVRLALLVPMLVASAVAHAKAARAPPPNGE